MLGSYIIIIAISPNLFSAFEAGFSYIYFGGIYMLADKFCAYLKHCTIFAVYIF